MTQEKIQTKAQALYAEGAKLGPLQSLTMAEFKAKYRAGPRIRDFKDERVCAALANDPRTVWTELQTDQRRVIVNGWCYINREAYYISEVPCASMTDHIEIEL